MIILTVFIDSNITDAHSLLQVWWHAWWGLLETLCSSMAGWQAQQLRTAHHPPPWAWLQHSCTNYSCAASQTWHSSFWLSFQWCPHSYMLQRPT